MIKYKLQNVLKDLTRGNIKFFVAGLRNQIKSRGVTAISVPDGDRLYVRAKQSDFSTLRQVFRDQEYRLPDEPSRFVKSQYESILARGETPVIIDAGANIGAASVWFKRRYPDSIIIGVEPDPETALLAQKNVNDLQGVRIVCAAIGGQAGFVSVVPADKAWAVQTERAATGCPIVTVDELVASVPNGRLLIVKVDIEGFESDLFDGDLKWLDEVSLVYVEPHDWMLPGKCSSASFQAAFGTRSFAIYISGENLLYMRR